MIYAGATYGNAENAPRYAVKLSRAGRESVSISFIFDIPAGGRGVGDAKGNVRTVSLVIPADTAQALSHALQLTLANTASSETQFQIDEHTPALTNRE
jgi:hypothetical protein